MVRSYASEGEVCRKEIEEFEDRDDEEGKVEVEMFRLYYGGSRGVRGERSGQEEMEKLSAASTEKTKTRSQTCFKWYI